MIRFVKINYKHTLTTTFTQKKYDFSIPTSKLAVMLKNDKDSDKDRIK